MPRIEQIQEMLATEPDDVFLNYSLAMELLKEKMLRTDSNEEFLSSMAG